MKRLSVKLKITLWFTLFMILLCVLIFVFVALVSGSTAASETQSALAALVDQNMREVEYDDGEPDIDDDFISFQNGIYCLVFEGDQKVSGYAPYKAIEVEPFEEGTPRTVSTDDGDYLIYDRGIGGGQHTGLWLRGAVSADGGAYNAPAVYRAALIALPLLVLLAAVGGYLLAGRLLQPIGVIGKTAEEIGSSGDLSKRIHLDQGEDELHQLARTFNNMFDRLETNFEAERRFTSDASHELRTPVTTILAQCEYAFENASGEQELYEAIGSIQKQGYRMSHLIESLLQFTRMEQQTEKPAFEPVDLSALVRSVCGEQRESAEKNISLSADIQPDVTVQGNKILLIRLLENLIRNAYRYGREHGNIRVSLKDNGNAVMLAVTDDGIGIAPEETEKIWSRFYRVDQSRGTGTGFGLGLSMVRQIAALHGGSARVESSPGKGSVFTILLPKKR